MYGASTAARTVYSFGGWPVVTGAGGATVYCRAWLMELSITEEL